MRVTECMIDPQGITSLMGSGAPSAPMDCPANCKTVNARMAEKSMPKMGGRIPRNVLRYGSQTWPTALLISEC